MSALLSHDVPGGAAWSVAVRAGREVRLTALGDGASCSTLIYSDKDVDRLNIPDTLKAQMSARVHAPMVLMSDRGTALVSVTGSSLDWHDCLGGHSLDSHVSAFGPSSYATDRNGWRQSARSGLLSELTKHGRSAAELHACVNFFAKVATTDQGALAFVPDHSVAEDWVSLRTEQDILLVCSTSPHPLDARWAPPPVRVEIFPAEPYDANDPSMTFRSESARALIAAKEALT